MAGWFDTHRESRIHCADDARSLARQRLPQLIFDFVDGATGREVGSMHNTQAFDRIALQPRVMRPVESRSLGTTLLGQSFARPFGIAPMGMCNLVSPGADAMLARAATRFDIPLCVSTASSSTLEDMRLCAGDKAWFQLYVQGGMQTALELVDRAASAGYTTLVLTVDVPQVSRRVRDLRNGFGLPFRIGPRQFIDFALHPRWSLSTLVHGTPSPRNFPASGSFDRGASRAGADWDFLDQLRTLWNRNLIVKGVLSTEDAVRIRQAGADAIWVSNHGGRQLDAAPTAIEMLPRIRDAVGAGFPLIFDSGVRQGEDIVRALASGADFVMLGRPVLFAIGAEQETGLNAFFTLLSKELDIALAQLGLSDVRQIDHLALAARHRVSRDAEAPEPDALDHRSATLA